MATSTLQRPDLTMTTIVTYFLIIVHSEVGGCKNSYYNFVKYLSIEPCGSGPD